MSFELFRAYTNSSCPNRTYFLHSLANFGVDLKMAMSFVVFGIIKVNIEFPQFLTVLRIIFFKLFKKPDFLDHAIWVTTRRLCITWVTGKMVALRLLVSKIPVWEYFLYKRPIGHKSKFRSKIEIFGKRSNF